MHYVCHIFDVDYYTTEQFRANAALTSSRARRIVRQCGLVVSAPAWDGTGCEFDSWQCRIYIPCSLSLRLLEFVGYSM